MDPCAPPLVAPHLAAFLPAAADSTCCHERRHRQRSDFRYRFRLTPLDEAATDREPIYVEGRDVSPSGLGFEHPEPITYRKVRLTAADPRLEELGLGDLELDVTLKWCRFVGAKSYESGGRVTKTTAPLF